MKKLITIIMAICFTILITACSPTTTTELTKENYTNFLAIEYKIENCVVNNNTYYCNVVVSTKAKKEAKFSNVEIGFTLSCYGFIAYSSNLTLQPIPFMYTPQGKYTLYINEDGSASTTVSVKSTTAKDFPSTSRLKFVIQKISGKVVY